MRWKKKSLHCGPGSIRPHKSLSWRCPLILLHINSGYIKVLQTQHYKTLRLPCPCTGYSFSLKVLNMQACTHAHTHTHTHTLPSWKLMIHINTFSVTAPNVSPSHCKIKCFCLLFRVGHNWETSLSLFTFMHWRRKWQPTPVFLPGESQERGSLVGCHLQGRTELDTTEAT